MKFFLDENFPKAAHPLLKNLGHEIFDLRGTSREGSADTKIFQEAQDCEAVFLTTDRDFFHTVPHLYPQHEGVVVIALRQPNRANILDKLSDRSDARVGFIQQELNALNDELKAVGSSMLVKHGSILV